jgi:hypothetical protein
MIIARNRDHIGFVFEAREGCLAKSLSDLRGVDKFIHHNRVSGVFNCLNNGFVRSDHRPRMQAVESVYRDLRKALPAVIKEAGAGSPSEARVFSNLVVAASISARRRISWLRE